MRGIDRRAVAVVAGGDFVDGVRRAAIGADDPRLARGEQELRRLRGRSGVLPAICRGADRAGGVRGQQPGGGRGHSHHGARSGARRCHRRRARRRDRRRLGRRLRHGGRGERLRLCADVAAAAIRRHVCPVHERAWQLGARLLAAARRTALWGARPVALRGSAGPAALWTRGLPGGYPGAYPGAPVPPPPGY